MRGTWLTLAVTLTMQAMVSMALLALPVIAPVVALALGVPTTYTGLYVAVVYIGAVAGSLAGGVVRFCPAQSRTRIDASARTLRSPPLNELAAERRGTAGLGQPHGALALRCPA